jgi:hypothetical protein
LWFGLHLAENLFFQIEDFLPDCHSLRAADGEFDFTPARWAKKLALVELHCSSAAKRKFFCAFARGAIELLLAHSRHNNPLTILRVPRETAMHETVRIRSFSEEARELSALQ